MESATAAMWRPQRVALSTSCARVQSNEERQSIWLGAFVVLAVVLEALGRGVRRRG